MPTSALLCDADITLEKFPGKGGWTYAPLPATAEAPKSWFNMARASGQIDGYALENVSVMPLGQGRLFLPVRASIRKQIGKHAGDTVRLVLHLHAPVATPPRVTAEELRACLADVPGALETFGQLAAAQQAAWVAWVAAAPTDEQQVARVETACWRLAHAPAGAPCLPPH